jgi:hypothetical protein
VSSENRTKGVFQGVNPLGCQVGSFKAPSAEELDDDFLWRYRNRAPSTDMIHIFNRSHCEVVSEPRRRPSIADTLEVMDPRYPAAEPASTRWWFPPDLGWPVGGRG